MDALHILVDNFFSPIVLAFLLGVIAQLVKSELEFPEPILKFLSVYLLLSIGIKGGHELIGVTWAEISGALMITLAMTIFIPVHAYLVLRKLGGFDIANAAGIAAHYGSVSSVTFFAALAFANAMQTSPEGFMPALVAIMEWSIIVALFIARWAMSREQGKVNQIGQIFKETLRGRGVILLSGGMLIGYLIGDKGYAQISPFFEDLFRGILVIFLLEMGMTAARQLRDFAAVGPFMVIFGIVAPIIHATIGAALATLAGLGLEGIYVFACICASASYIDAPAAVRAALPQANPSIYLTASLGITFPFNLLIGLPLYYKISVWMQGLLPGLF